MFATPNSTRVLVTVAGILRFPITVTAMGTALAGSALGAGITEAIVDGDMAVTTEEDLSGISAVPAVR